MSEREKKRGILSQLAPVPRFVAVLGLGGAALCVLYFIDPTGFCAQWRNERLVFVERILNILVASGTVWIVLFEADAILAAFARVFVERFALAFSAITDALRRAGLSASSIQAILADILERMPSRAARARQTTPPPSAEPSEATPVAANSAPHKTREATPQDAARPTKAYAQSTTRIPWRWLALLAFMVGAFGVWLAIREPAPPPPTSPPRAAQQLWISAQGSVSQTLTACLGRQSWEELEQTVATANAIACSQIVSRLVVYEPAHIVIAGKARSVVMPG